MTPGPAARLADRGPRARWRSRPAPYRSHVWALLFALDLLPWPWGERIVTVLFAVSELLRADRRRRALVWASAQAGHRPWRLAAALGGFVGRRVARATLLGMRGPEALTRHLVVRGEQHLTGGGAILLTFHVGPLNADLALRLRGHRVAWLGSGERASLGWWRDGWRTLHLASEHLAAGLDSRQWPGLLYRAGRILREGGHVYVTADGRGRRELFRIPLPVRPVIVRPGWLALHRHTGARVLPMLTHLEGPTQVVVIHPPLPLPAAGRDDDGAWQRVLADLLGDYARRFPEQCSWYVFFSGAPQPETTDARTPARSRSR